MKRIAKRILLSLLVLFLLIQFIPRPKKNIDANISTDITRVHSVPSNVQSVLKTCCYDCHSNNTYYPWYYNLQPVAWWLDNHIKDAKKELNFSEFASYNLARQYRKLEEISKEVKEDEMPLPSYTLIHRYAKPSTEQKLAIANWTAMLRDSMKRNYPVDSLIRKKK